MISLITLALIFLPALLLPGIAEPVRAQDELSAGLVVEGTVLTSRTGDPIPNAEVTLVGGSRASVVDFFANRGRTVVTGRTGTFRFEDLTAGDYRITAERNDGSGATVSRNIRVPASSVAPLILPLPPVAIVSGVVADPGGNPLAGVDVRLVRESYYYGRRTLVPVPGGSSWARSDERGSYTLSAPAGRYLLRMNVDGQSLRQYYRGAFAIEDAIPLTLTAGAVMGGIDLTPIDGERYRIRFRLSLPQAPSQVEGVMPIELHAAPVGLGRVREFGFPVHVEQVEDGEYLSALLAPGSYELLIRYSFDLREALPDVSWPIVDPIARVSIVLEDDDLDLGTIVPATHAPMEGRVVVPVLRNDDEPEELPDFAFAHPDFPLGFVASPSETGTFVVEGVAQGPWILPRESLRFVNAHLPDGWYLQSITAGFQDVLRDGFNTADAFGSPLEIVLADDAARVSGAVRDDDALAPNARVILVPSAGSRGPYTNFPDTTASDSGIYSLSHVPPGEYRIVAFEESGMNGRAAFWEDPEFLREHEFRGDRVFLDPGVETYFDVELIVID